LHHVEYEFMKVKFLIGLFFSVSVLYGQNYSFETGTTTPFRVADPSKAALNIVQAPYKDGAASLSWQWTAPSVLIADVEVTHKNFRDGVIFWVYNEQPRLTPLRGEYRDRSNVVRYTFEFGLNFSGWRICRIGSKYMSGNKQVTSGLKLHLNTPLNVNQGRLFIDRFSFVADVNYQNAPDAQQPNNTEALYINHWNSLWKWESKLSYDIAVPSQLNNAQLVSLTNIEKAIDQSLTQSASSSLITSANNLLSQTNIRTSGNYLLGRPLVVKPDKTSLDNSFAELGTMMMGMAQDALFNKNQTSRDEYLKLWDYALDQGFAWGSAMGNNHHYGYETRQIFESAWMMRQELKSTERLNDVAATLSFWSGLPETRTIYDTTRDGVVDSWNTLLFARLISAMLIDDLTVRHRAVNSLVRWVDTSLKFTPGNMGGFKPDGTVFHHAGHYPAYAIGGLAGVGSLLPTLPDSEFNLSLESRRNLAEALLSMSHYTHMKDWTIGVAGRHPHQGAMSHDVVETFAYLALLGGIYNPGEETDSKLAAEYLRLETEDTSLKKKFSAYTAGAFPQGFYVLNHAALGVHRFGNSMVTLKGYNSDVWGSEIYTNDNRYGRYQSYGAVEILNGGSPVSREYSRFSENGWDWNRLPGTTTIHLPLNLLESPQTNTLMARSKEDFAGASSLLDLYGIFGMKLREENTINNTNYTPDFKARKSVFAFGKRLICIGTDINNSNSDYSTETTLFQQSIASATEKISANGNFVLVNDYIFDSQTPSSATVLSDLTGNYYRVSSRNRVKISGGEQVSAHNKTKAETSGNFVTARIDHGANPIDGHYEYMIMLKPSPAEQRQWSADPAYRVLQADKTAHIVQDVESGVMAYVCFELTNPSEGNVKSISHETLLMYKDKDDKTISMSVCDPSLHLPVKTSNSDATSAAGLTVVKQVFLAGSWQLTTNSDKVQLSYSGGNTMLQVSCILGIPVTFEVEKMATSVSMIVNNKLHLLKNGNSVTVQGMTDSVSVIDITGKIVAQEISLSEEKTFLLNRDQLYVITAIFPDGTIVTQKFIL
jgi:chondroitin-sulfate-ABC endolyase/exolyase